VAEEAGSSPLPDHVDVVVVGAGLSGIGQGYHLQTRCPDRSYLILESRGAIGGTWDLFRYPGVRSDSDMHTLGFSFHPWTDAKSIADGASIRDYIEDTARTYGIDRRIRFNTRVQAAAWSTADARWTLTVTGADGQPTTISCNFLCMCAGYYNYARGHAPEFAGADTFQGRIVHPQFWPADLDYAGSQVVVIGSGATAVTLVPAMARDAAHVTMLQRSPTYVVARPGEDAIANRLRRWLPPRLAYRITRRKNVLLGMFIYNRVRKYPALAKKRIIGMVRDQLGPAYDVETHFTPTYDPWDQRLCLVPDADLFNAIKSGRAEVVTDTINRLTPDGILLVSGRELAADVIVTATGLEVQLLSRVALTVDGVPVEIGTTIQYKGMMFSDVPNLASSFGYTNASWTLKADLIATYVCRLLNVMRARGVRQATPHLSDPAMPLEPLVGFSSGYIQRAADKMPRQGTRKPWKLHQNYARDLFTLRFGSVEDDMIFSNPEPRGRWAS
jgi:monooxygenase